MVSVQARSAFVQYLHACAGERVCVCVCLKREGRAVHQISHLIWAASGEVKGAVGRLSSLRRRGEKKERQNQDGVSVKEDGKAGERLKPEG